MMANKEAVLETIYQNNLRIESQLKHKGIEPLVHIIPKYLKNIISMPNQVEKIEGYCLTSSIAFACSCASIGLNLSAASITIGQRRKSPGSAAVVMS